MIEPVPFRPDRFRSVAPHYLKGRAPYSRRLIDHVIGYYGLGRESRVMDLGCGPGQLAAAFAPHIHSVLAVDPDEEMLEAARETNATFENVTLHRGSSADLDDSFGPFAAVLMGRSFHWMDRPATLRMLDKIVMPDGVVICFETHLIDVPENAWKSGFETLLDRYRDELPVHRQPGWVHHEAVMLDSPFGVLDSIGVIERRAISSDILFERALSMSSTSRARLEAKTEALKREIEEYARSIAVDDTITEVVKSVALCATRP
jgi:SAM-dependent methyltransferase